MGLQRLKTPILYSLDRLLSLASLGRNPDIRWVFIAFYDYLAYINLKVSF